MILVRKTLVITTPIITMKAPGRAWGWAKAGYVDLGILTIFKYMALAIGNPL